MEESQKGDVASDAVRDEYRSSAQGWLRSQDVFDAEEGGRRLSTKLIELARIGPGATVLDVGGGHGEPTLAVARVVGPSGRVVCVDMSAEMLAIARQRATEAELSNVELVEGSIDDIDLTPETFDAVVSRFALMFVPDLPATLERLLTLLTPGGRLAAAVWGPLERVEFGLARIVICDELGVPRIPVDGPNPFKLADRAALASRVARAGFREVETGTVDLVFETESPERYISFVQDLAAPLVAMLKDKAPQERDRIWAKAAAAYAELADAHGRVRTHSEAVWVTGEK